MQRLLPRIVKYTVTSDERLNARTRTHTHTHTRLQKNSTSVRKCNHTEENTAHLSCSHKQPQSLKLPFVADKQSIHKQHPVTLQTFPAFWTTFAWFVRITQSLEMICPSLREILKDGSWWVLPLSFKLILGLKYRMRLLLIFSSTITLTLTLN